MDDTGEVRTKRSLNRQANAKAGTDQAFEAFAAYVMSHHFGRSAGEASLATTMS
jgi:hypothetical protein